MAGYVKGLAQDVVETVVKCRGRLSFLVATSAPDSLESARVFCLYVQYVAVVAVGYTVY